MQDVKESKHGATETPSRDQEIKRLTEFAEKAESEARRLFHNAQKVWHEARTAREKASWLRDQTNRHKDPFGFELEDWQLPWTPTSGTTSCS